ncbi:isochorismatase family protein [Chelatococcus composti]|jgi:Amidases related to nicotinamidase|uniref:Nicotinamidase-related amidase n=1 Tax=Chelatococcus composti TaxID=1743235 RepID=A0A841KCW5_9HYPH|nr:isochorismatase family protein [Chelatococcus composti]MBB6167826.1 nicotinamidase-related amidase [Chelatococcus composti]MBS7734979.1 isochorismatase family protein [Chelatococcus composti]PZN42107.1 MAG: isochorismatase [Pseudomonadota bacterium]GGG35643.1 isochorismatase [Chelatococcus composti]
MIIEAERSCLLLVDFQGRLAPAIAEAEQSVAAARRLALAARLLGVPVIASEQNPQGLGPTIDALRDLPELVVAKTSFDASRELELQEALDEERDTVLVAGWEAHVCVLQTAFGLKRNGFAPIVVADAVGSRQPANRAAALERLARHGIEIVTSEMVIFEWLQDCEHPRFREVLALIK